MYRQKRIALIGNGKTFKYRLKDAIAHANTLAIGVSSGRFPNVLVAYAPPLPLLGNVSSVFRDQQATDVILASQSISWRRFGMDTGGVPADSLVDLDARLAIVNHSEQKAQLKYSPDYYHHCMLQITNAIDSGLQVVFCCGEDRGDQEGILERQLSKDLLEVFGSMPEMYRKSLLDYCSIAYEPGGAVGTGKAAPLSHIQQAFANIRQIFQEVGYGIPRLLYGGGVSLENLSELHCGLASDSGFWGYLVGEASARGDEFIQMAQWLNSHTFEEGRAEEYSNVPASIDVSPETGRQIVEEIRSLGKTRVAIVGFGEIGAATAIVCAQRRSESIEVVQLFNRQLSPEDACARVQYSRFVDPEDVSYFQDQDRSYLRILNQLIKIEAQTSMEDAASKLDDVDVVIFTVGEFTKDQAFMRPFLAEGRAKTVLVTCETAAADFHMVPGFNHNRVNVGQHRVIALGSCTGNCAVPTLAIIENEFGEGSIRGVYAVAPHSKTNTQEIGNKGVDPKKEGFLGNLIPTTTGLSKLLQYPGFFEMFSDSIEAVSIRTPTEDVSLLCMTVDVETNRDMTSAELRSIFRSASQSPRWKGIVGYDQARGTKVYWKDTHACVVFEPYVRFIPKFLRSGERSPLASISIMAAYSNVFGYSSQVARGVMALGLARNEKVLTTNDEVLVTVG